MSECAYVRDIFAEAPWFDSRSQGWHRQCLKSSRKVYSGCTSPQVCVTTFNAPYPSQAKHRGPPWNLSHEFPFMRFYMLLSFLLSIGFQSQVQNVLILHEYTLESSTLDKNKFHLLFKT